MSKFDKVRKDIKRKTNKLHFLYVFLFVVFTIINIFYLVYENKQYKELETVVKDYQDKSMKLGDRLLTTIVANKQYSVYFDSLPFGNPIDSIIVNSRYGWRFHPVDSCYKFHTGVDFNANMNTPIFSSGSGVVIFTGWKSGYGKTIMLKHPFDNISLYAHLNKILVDSGQFISKGDTIALSGRTGKVSGPHLHYELRIKDKSINPFEYLKISNSSKTN